jgi:hypothetical protein
MTTSQQTQLVSNQAASSFARAEDSIDISKYPKLALAFVAKNMSELSAHLNDALGLMNKSQVGVLLSLVGAGFGVGLWNMVAGVGEGVVSVGQGAGSGVQMAKAVQNGKEIESLQADMAEKFKSLQGKNADNFLKIDNGPTQQAKQLETQPPGTFEVLTEKAGFPAGTANTQKEASMKEVDSERKLLKEQEARLEKIRTNGSAGQSMGNLIQSSFGTAKVGSEGSRAAAQNAQTVQQVENNLSDSGKEGMHSLNDLQAKLNEQYQGLYRQLLSSTGGQG